MGSFKNKINNNKKKKKETAVVNELIALKKKMKEQYTAKEYGEAIDTMAEIANHKKMDPEVMLMGANCYFMLGDYERATNWVNNTLTFNPQNVGARILLFRLCVMQDDWEQGLKILNFVAENQQAAMSDKDKDDFKEIVKCYNLNMNEAMAKYPALVDYLKENCEEKVPPQQVNVENTRGKAKAAVDRLKELLHKSKGQQVSQQPAQEVPKPSTTMAESITAINAVDPEVTESDDINENVTEFLNKVMSSNISMREKIKTLNNYASGLYLGDDYAGALTLLKKALEMDSGDPFVLRNIAYVCVAMKDKEKALGFAKALPMLDFALLQSIKEL